LISDGSELLMLDPRVRGLVGSVVLPILGAVPDGVMTLFSGLGEDAQKEVSLGVGVLAGSTVMLLTFPWFIAVFCGAVPENASTGGADYKNKKGKPWCVQFDSEVADNAKFMLFSTLTYLVIQVPASIAENNEQHPAKSAEDYANITAANQRNESKYEANYALVGLCLSVVLFLYYLYLQVKAQNDDKAVQTIIREITAGTITLATALSLSKKMDDDGKDGGAQEPLLKEKKEKEDKARLKKIIGPFFRRYDTTKDKQLNKTEFSLLMKDLGESLNKGDERLNEIFTGANKDGDNLINLAELVEFLYKYVRDPESFEKVQAAHRQGVADKKTKTGVLPEKEDEDDAEEEEGDEAVQEWQKQVDEGKMNKDEMIMKIWFRASWMMLLGVTVVLVVSDPFVDVLNVWGARLGIPGFYVSFVIAPFASNASELLSAANYAVKKTKTAMTTALSTLVGAACMNNTFVLAIFFALLYFKNLAWEFTAETIAIIVVQWLIGALAIFKDVHNYIMGIGILLCYPLCLAIVAGLEAQGID